MVMLGIILGDRIYAYLENDMPTDLPGFLIEPDPNLVVDYKDTIPAMLELSNQGVKCEGGCLISLEGDKEGLQPYFYADLDLLREGQYLRLKITKLEIKDGIMKMEIKFSK